MPPTSRGVLRISLHLEGPGAEQELRNLISFPSGLHPRLVGHRWGQRCWKYQGRIPSYYSLGCRHSGGSVPKCKLDKREFSPMRATIQIAKRSLYLRPGANWLLQSKHFQLPRSPPAGVLPWAHPHNATRSPSQVPSVSAKGDSIWMWNKYVSTRSQILTEGGQAVWISSFSCVHTRSLSQQINRTIWIHNFHVTVYFGVEVHRREQE